jgi:predicted nucleotidyltransferase
MINDIIQKTKEFFERDPDVLLALLFGSFATGKAGPKSDVDIGVAYPSRLSLEERISKAQALSAEINKEVDLIDLHDARGLLLQQVLVNRTTLVNRDPELYGMIIARRINEEEDLMPLYEKALQARRERFLNGHSSNKPKT